MVVVAMKYGQLGNRLFTFAHVAASALEHGYEVWNPAFGEYARFFPATEGDALCRFPPRRSRLRGARTRSATYRAARVAAALAARMPTPLRTIRLAPSEQLDLGSPEFVSAARRRVVLVQGWLLRDPDSLARHSDDVRAFFRPHRRHLDAAQAAVQTARGAAELLVGIHVRRGDYRSWEGGRYCWDDATYRSLMDALTDAFAGRRVAFLVCSDEPVQSLPGGRGPEHPVSDLYALAQCDYLLGPPSTYSAWASFYGRVPLWTVRDPAEPPSPSSFSVYGEGNTS